MSATTIFTKNPQLKELYSKLENLVPELIEDPDNLYTGKGLEHAFFELVRIHYQKYHMSLYREFRDFERSRAPRPRNGSLQVLFDYSGFSRAEFINRFRRLRLQDSVLMASDGSKTGWNEVPKPSTGDCTISGKNAKSISPECKPELAL